MKVETDIHGFFFTPETEEEQARIDLWRLSNEPPLVYFPASGEGRVSFIPSGNDATTPPEEVVHHYPTLDQLAQAGIAVDTHPKAGKTWG